MHNISLCSLCEKSVNHRSSIKCNLCHTISHLKCNDLNYVDGLYLKNFNISWYCRGCCEDLFPFTNINNYKLYLSLSKRNMSCIKTLENLCDFFNQFSNLSNQNKNQENVSNCKYYDFNEIK